MRVPRTKPAPANIKHVDLADVRHSPLGSAIELMESELPAIEAMYLALRDTDQKSAQELNTLLESIDYLLAEYNSVR